jgi:hypothetical protein
MRPPNICPKAKPKRYVLSVALTETISTPRFVAIAGMAGR